MLESVLHILCEKGDNTLVILLKTLSDCHRPDRNTVGPITVRFKFK